MPIDDIIGYLNHCGGSDTIILSTGEKAQLAQEALCEQFEAHGIAPLKRPVIIVTGCELFIRLPKEIKRESDRQAQEVQQCR